ncbi:MAG: Maf family protein [Clostridia bacterium]|nr:Maf family protein [Clostridia bacterium]
MKDIVLASASPRRLELLKQIGITFRVIPSDIEEKVDDCLPAGIVAENLAFEKAVSVAKQIKSDTLVIGADTIVVKDRILGKPQSEENAFEMLKSLSGSWHEVITGVTVVDCLTMEYRRQHEITRVKMRELSESTINAYVGTGEPVDKAGAYGIQGIGAVLVERIEGCYFNVVGLPLTRLVGMLEDYNVKVL